MSLPAHPCRAILLVALAACALLRSAAPARAEMGSLPMASHEVAITSVAAASPASILSIPEPGVLVSLAGGVGVLLGLQRFRRRT